MYKDYNSNVAYLYTFPVSNLSVNFKEYEFDCQININKKDYDDFRNCFHRKTNKKDLFNDIYKIGKMINKKIKNIVFKPQLYFENLVSTNNLKNNRIFFTINLDELFTEKDILIEIGNFFIKYGVSNSETILDIQRNNLLTVFDNSLKIGVWINNDSLLNKKEVTIDKNNIVISTTIEIIPFLNTCMLIYYIKRFKYAINKGESSTIFNLLPVFPELEKFGIIISNKDSYNENTKKNIIEYVNKILFKLSPYLEQNFPNNFQRTIYTNLEDIYDNRDLQQYFNLAEYNIISPVLAAYDYMLQTLRGNNTLEYYCDNCGAILRIKEPLCYDCKIDFYYQVIEKYKNKNKKMANELEKELDLFIKESKTSLIPTSTSLIDQIYMNRKKSNKNYHKKKDNS